MSYAHVSSFNVWDRMATTKRIERKLGTTKLKGKKKLFDHILIVQLWLTTFCSGSKPEKDWWQLWCASVSGIEMIHKQYARKSNINISILSYNGHALKIDSFNRSFVRSFIVGRRRDVFFYERLAVFSSTDPFINLQTKLILLAI